MDMEQVIKIEPMDIDPDPNESGQEMTELQRHLQLSPLQLQLSQSQVSTSPPSTLNVAGDIPSENGSPKIIPSGPTNYERYNILVKAYIAAHPQLPRQMQYAEAQQVWRSVRMDPYGAYLEVLRSLHGMALLAEAAGMITPSYEVTLQHPLMIQALNPAMRIPLADRPMPPRRIRNRNPKPRAIKPKPLKVMKIMSLTAGGNRGSGMNKTYECHARTYGMERTSLPIKRPRGRPRKIRIPTMEELMPKVTSSDGNDLPETTSSSPHRLLSPLTPPPLTPTSQATIIMPRSTGPAVKRKRGRPRKIPRDPKWSIIPGNTSTPIKVPVDPNLLGKKRGRGRPRKIRPWEVQIQEFKLPEPRYPPQPLAICYPDFMANVSTARDSIDRAVTNIIDTATSIPVDTNTQSTTLESDATLTPPKSTTVDPAEDSLPDKDSTEKGIADDDQAVDKVTNEEDPATSAEKPTEEEPGANAEKPEANAEEPKTNAVDPETASNSKEPTTLLDAEESATVSNAEDFPPVPYVVESPGAVEASEDIANVENTTAILEIAEDGEPVFSSPLNFLSTSTTESETLPLASGASLPPDFTPNLVMTPKQEAMDAQGSEQWVPQAGLSFVQGNGLKMILSRVNNGIPIPEYKRRRSRRKTEPKQVPGKSRPSPQVQNIHTLVDMVPEELSPRDQPADSTVMDIMAHHIPLSASHYGLELEQSPDQPFAAAILQYLLDLAEMMGSASTFVISQETENPGGINGQPHVCVYSGWLMGDQSSGPKLMATSRISTRTNEIDNLSELVNNEDFQEVVRTQYGGVKPVAILILEGRRAGAVGKLLEDSIDCFKEWDLDSIILASQPVGGNHILTTLDNNFDQNVMANGGHSLPETDYIQHRTQTMEMEQWKNYHVRESQYYLQVVKCSNQACCSALRTPLKKLLQPQGFLPAPVPFARGEQGPIAPEFNDREVACYGRLCERLVMEPLIPTTAFRALPFDFYCPSAHTSLSKQVCFDCGRYFGNPETRKLHSKFLHANVGDKNMR